MREDPRNRLAGEDPLLPRQREWLMQLIERQPTVLALWECQGGKVFTMGAV
jgi:hypothetical protein